jgi:hypothetical protein
MITLACTNCKTLLTMDEAFAGGVCRCQHCGTIQTVPSHLKQGSTSTAPAGQAVGASKSLYQQTRAPTDAASGLEALGDAVTSSGLGSRRLQNPRSMAPGSPSVDRPPAQPAPTAKNPLVMPLLIAVGVLVVLVIALMVFLLTRSGSPSPAPTDSTGNLGNPGNPDNSIVTQPPAPVAGPSFGSTAIKGSSVVYLIDRGNATQDYFDGLKALLLKSLHSLGPDRTFRMMLWNNDQDPVVYPITGVVDATDDNIKHVEDALRDVTASGKSSMAAQLADAIRLKPDAIVIVTAKYQLTDDDPAALQNAAKSGVRLYLFAVGDTDLSSAMSPAASASGGTFHPISASELQQFSQ